MSKKMKRNPIAIPSGVEAVAVAKRGQVITKRIALGFVSILGLLVLYFCLIPALAQDGNSDTLYVFFDNGLSQYEGKTENGTTTVVVGSVYDSADDDTAETLEMKRLSDVILYDADLWNSVKTQLGNDVDYNNNNGKITLVNVDNINPHNVYVSATEVNINKYISFDAWDSGTVYDTVTNYRVNSASREWGYDYNDFQWTSPKTLFTAEATCYYAPPKMMEFRYSAKAATTDGGEKSVVQMIYAHGDKKDGDYSKPEAPNAWVAPENANGRTFWDAELKMEGAFGKVTKDNELGKNSQSSANGKTLEGSVALNGDGTNGIDGVANKVYHANATFFDYFSDWELAGNALEDHELSYGFTDAEAADKLLYTFTAKKDTTTLSYNATETESTESGVTYTEKTINFSDDNHGFVPIAGVDVGQGELSDKVTSHTSDGSKVLSIHNATRGAVEYALDVGSSDVTKSYDVTVWALAGSLSNGTNRRFIVELYVNGSKSETLIGGYDAEGNPNLPNAWTEFTIANITIPEGASSAALRIYASAGSYIDDFYIKTTTTTTTSTGDSSVEKTPGTTIFANDNHGFVDQNGAAPELNTETKYNKTAGDGSGSLIIPSTNSIKYAIADVSDSKFYDASIWAYPRVDAERIVSVSLNYNLNGEPNSVELATASVAGYNWTEVDVSFKIPTGATDVYLVYTHNNDYCHYDDFTLTASTTTGSGSKDEDSADHVLARALGFGSSKKPSMYIYSTEYYLNDDGERIDYEPDDSGYSNKELYYATIDVYVEQDCELVFTAKHYDSFDYTNNKPSGNLVKEEEVCTVSVKGGTWTTISTEKFDLPIPAVSTELSVAVKGDSNAKIYTESFQLYRGYFNKNVVLGDVVTAIDFENGDGGFADNLPSSSINGSASKLTSIGVVDDNVDNKVLKVVKKSHEDTEDIDYYSSLDNSDEGMAMITLDVTAGQRYMVSGEVKHADTDPKAYSAKFYVEYLDVNGAVISSSSDLERIEISDTDKSADTWHEFKSYFKPPTDTVKVRIGVYVNSGATGYAQNYYFDNFVLQKVSATEQAISGSFSEGTNRISYSYQGLSFNDAISKYYKEFLGTNAADTIVPLYFGSNSWMPGNNRYFAYDNNKQALFDSDQIDAALKNQADAVYTITESIASGSAVPIIDYYGAPYGGAYIQPYSRQYWLTVFGFTKDDDNEPHGFSNSRAVEGLVTYDPSQDILMLNGASVETPYFNEEFLKGDNEANAAYGEVYENVDFAFAYNEDTGYYEFDSTRAWYATRLTQNAAGGYYMDYYNYDQIVTHLNEKNSDGKLVEYKASDLMGVKKADTSYKETTGSSQTIYQFYPFNSPDTNDRFSTENLMFGMKLDIPFNMFASADKRNNSMFKFSGDDDVWVYVDGKKALDIGGTHTAVGGIVDLKNGYGVVGSSYANYTGISQKGSSDDANITIQSGKAGTDQGVTKAEKAAFALLASLDEIAIDPATVTALSRGASTGFVNAKGVNGWSDLDSVSFFDDKFEPMDTYKIKFQYQIRRLSDSDELVIDVAYQNINGVSAAAGVAEYVTFDLNQFELAKTEENVDLTEHELTIYYLERGLNSSNFKLAFNFLPNAQREVEKVWADGNSQHVNDDDYVNVELWRTEPEEKTVENADVSIPDDYALIRAIAHSSKTDSGVANSTFVKDGSEVTVQFELNDANINSAATLSLNSAVLSLEAYRQFYEKLGMRIYINDNLVSTGNGDAVVDDYEFFKPEADYITAYPTRDLSKDTDNVVTTTEQEYTAIKIPKTEGKTIVKIVFTLKDGYAAECGNDDTKFNTWGMYNCNAWLLEAYAFDADASDDDTATDPSISVTSSSVFGTNSTPTVAAKNAARTLTAADMQIAIAHAARLRGGYYMSDYFASASLPEDSLTLTYTFGDSSEDARQLAMWSGSWSNPFASISYTLDGTFNGASPIDCSTGRTYAVKTNGSNSTGVLITRIGCETDSSGAVGRGITYKATNTVTKVTYSAPVKVGETETLNNASSWKKLWSNIVESVQIGDKIYNYNYFIREVGVNSTYGKLLSNYETLYYDKNGNLITPTIIKGDNPETTDVETDYELKLYSIDTKTADGTKGYVKIVNNPITNVAINKKWVVKDDSDKIPIVVTIYGEDSTKKNELTVVKQILLSSENDWTATIEALPLFNPVTNGAMTYYAAEEIGAKYTATYSTTAVTDKKLNGSAITVYPLQKGTDGTFSLSITNQVEGFVLDINKVDTNNQPLEGAEFILEEWNGSNWVVVTSEASAANASLDLESVQSVEVDSSVNKTNANSEIYTHNFTTQGTTSGDFFTITGADGNFYNDNKAIIQYGDLALQNRLKMGSGQYITFTTSGPAEVTLVVGMHSNYPNTGGLQITKDTKDGSTVDSFTISESVNEYTLTIPQSGTYVICRTQAQHYLYYISVEVTESSTTTTTPKYNKYDAENFMNALNEDDSWFSSEEGIQLANDLVDLQLAEEDWGWGLVYEEDYGVGGWQKDPDYYNALNVTKCSTHWHHATIDNNVTTAHIRYLARAYSVTKNEQYKKSVIAGIQCLLNAQYSNGGWPSVFENNSKTDECGHDTYHNRITYNDSAMTKVMQLLLEVSNKQGDFSGIVDDTLAGNAKNAVMKGIDCILATQITLTLDGVDTLTAWCQQHDETTLKPAAARAHELAALSAMESVGIINFLKSVLNDTNLMADNQYYTKNDIIVSINAAVKWINDVKIVGYTYSKKTDTGVSPLTYTGNATDYLWARYYAIEAFPCDNYVTTGDTTDKIKAYDSKSDSTKIFDAYSGETTIAVNQPLFVERTSIDTSKYDPPEHYSYITPDTVNKTTKEYITVYNSLSGLPEDQQKSYSWYVTDGKNLVGAEDISTETDLTGTNISNVHVYDVSNFSGWEMGTNLQVGSKIFGDRDFTYTSLPEVLKGAEYVKTACDSKNYTSSDDTPLAVLTAAKNMDVYIALDSRTAEPSWLTTENGWTKTDLTATSSNDDLTFVFYKRSVTAGTTISLGENEQTSGCVGYTIMAVEQKEPVVSTTVSSTPTASSTTTTTTTSTATTPDSGEDTLIPDGAMIYITDQYGKITIGGLQPGKYRLTEVKAPIGCALDSTPIVFTVGVIAEGQENAGAVDTSKVDVNEKGDSLVSIVWTDKSIKNPTLTATIENEYLTYELPNTGESGITTIIIPGIVLLLMAYAGVQLHNKRGKRPV